MRRRTEFEDEARGAINTLGGWVMIGLVGGFILMLIFAALIVNCGH